MPSVIPWARLPQIRSTRNGRDRVYLVTEELFGTTGLKADHITYHPGDTPAAHDHVGSKHFFFVDSGTGILHLNDRTYELSKVTSLSPTTARCTGSRVLAPRALCLRTVGPHRDRLGGRGRNERGSE